jgi:hypothetical protein
MKCPDCGEMKQRGGGMIVHRINFCKKRQFQWTINLYICVNYY